MGRAPCCDKTKVKRGPWSLEEDTLLKEFIHTHGTGGNWISLPGKAGLNRCGKSCRLRWLNYLRPNIRHGGFTPEEDYLICTLYSSIGSRWSLIATKLPGRTDNDVKNYWNTKLKKKIMSGEVPGFETGSIFRTTNNCNINNSTELAHLDWTHLKNPKPEITAYEYGTSAIPYPTASLVYDPEVNSLSRCSSVSWGSSSSSTSVYDDQQMGGGDDKQLKEDDIDDFWLGLLVDQSTFMAGSPQGLHDKINELASLLDGPSYGIY